MRISRTPFSLAALLIALAMCVSLTPRTARAQSAVELAEQSAAGAREAYHSLDIENAQRLATEAVTICENGGCESADMARYYMLQGMVEFAASSDRERTRAMFRQAVHTDPSVELDPELATPELQEILIDAREDVNIDDSLSPDAVAARHQEDAPGGRDGASCRSDGTCAEGYICEDNLCVTGEREEEEEPPGPWQRIFVEVGFNMAASTASDSLHPDMMPELQFDSTNTAIALDPQTDTLASNDGYIRGGTNGCAAEPPPAATGSSTGLSAGSVDNYCVRVTEGAFVFSPAIHLALGAYFTDMLGVSLRLRMGFNFDGGIFDFLQVGLRFHLRFIVPRPTGFHMGAFLGASYGQVQVKPQQVGADDIWAQTGNIGIDLGANLGYRFLPNVGIFVQPGVYVLLPEVSIGLQATIGIDLAFGEVDPSAVEEEPEPEPTDDDRDGDRILNINDSCPDDAEDIDGYEDEDGCPEADNDGDGIEDSADACPREAEDMDDYEDQDGCPERDNDGDGVPDVDDQCPLEVGVGIAQGCPEPDTDGDGVVDRMDNCPAEAGPAENHGCVEEQFVEIQEDRLVITDKIYFRTNRDVIERRSYTLLAQLASVLNSHPNIAHVRIEGHTDSRGRASHNQRLSERRARAVMDHLIRRGDVDASRLEAHGYGSQRPIVENAESDEDHARNRRVEFVIVTEDEHAAAQ